MLFKMIIFAWLICFNQAYMKKFILLSVLCFLAGSAMAQEEDGYFNHMAAGLKVGTAGVGVELAAPIGSYFQLRAGYSMMPPVSYSRTVDVPEHPGKQGADKGPDIPVDAKATMHFQNAELMLDIFPSSESGFHITAGLFYGPKNAIKVTNTSPLPNDYNIVGLSVVEGGEDYTVRAVNNKVNGYIGVDALRPYLGIGFGRAVTTDRRVNFTFDLGAIYWGKPGLFAPGEPLIGDWKDVRITPESLNNRDDGLIKKAEKLVVYPMLNVHLFVNLF